MIELYIDSPSQQYSVVSHFLKTSRISLKSIISPPPDKNPVCNPDYVAMQYVSIFTM